jgi:hypothetical protein
MILRASRKTLRTESGVAAVEFALLSIMLFTFLFGAMETARALYLWSTTAEVVSRTARLAAVSSPGDEAAVRHKAMFRTAANKLPLGGEIDESYLRIDYLASDRATAITPAPAPLQNLINCTNSPTDAACIRFIRVRLCMPNTDCTPVPYKPMVALDSLNFFNITMPTFSTVVAADSLGLAPAP